MPIQLDVDIRGGRIVKVKELGAFNGSIDELKTKKLTVAEALAIAGTLDVQGAVSLGGTLGVAGNVALAGRARGDRRCDHGRRPRAHRLEGHGQLRLTPDSADATVTANFGNLNVVSNTTVGYPAFGYNIESGNAGNTWRFTGADNAIWFQFVGNQLNLYGSTGAPAAGGIIAKLALMTVSNGGRVLAGNALPFGSLVAVTNGAAAAAGTLGNAPVAGNPTRWMPFDDAGVTRYIPMW
jgi:hypothetical protein